MIAALLLVSAVASAAPIRVSGSGATIFREAGALYEKGKLAEALARYEKIAAAGEVSAALRHNLGNTHWRLGHRGLAILEWERARRLAPRDADIRFNLALARSALQDEEPSLWESLDRVLTPDELAWLLTALVWLLGGIAGVALWRDLPWERWRRFMIIGLPLLVVLSVWLGLRARDLSLPWAVVTAPTVEIRSGPGDQFPVGFTAPEGQRTLILSRRPGWIEVGVPSKNLKGWVLDSAVAAI